MCIRIYILICIYSNNYKKQNEKMKNVDIYIVYRSFVF